MALKFTTRSVKMANPPMALATALIMLAIFIVAAAPQTAFALRPVSRRHRILHRLRGILWNPLFRPSHDSLLRQNEEIDRLDLPRIQDDTELEALKTSGDLVPIEASESLKIEPSLDPSRRFCRPWTRDFVQDLSEVYYRQFHDQIQVNSAVRTVKVQKKLRRRNRNAAPAEGDTASSHLAGITVDLQRRGLTKEEIRFVEHYLFYLNALGLVEPEEESRHWCFHVMVSERYSDWRQTQTIFPHPPEEEPASAPIAAPVTATTASN
jgi:DNA-binding transcriptional ArsR family regulator